MAMMEVEKRNRKMMELLESLLDSETVKLDFILENRDDFDFPAVYVFNEPNSERIIYVGRTKTLPLWGRTLDHKTTDGRSDLNMMIKGRVGYSDRIGEYGVRCLEIKDSRERMFFENFAIALLRPELNKEG